MRCLEKDRSRRYETANALAMDLRRHLANEPVLARPPRTGYIIRKLVLRHRLPFAAAAVVLLTLVAGLTFSSWSLVRERAARARADVEAARSAEVARFMQNMLSGVGPQVALGRDTRLLRAILDETVERLRTELRGQPEVEASLRATLGNIYRDLGELPNAALMQESALRIRREHLGPVHPALAESLHQYGEVLALQHRLPEAERALREALALRAQFPGHEPAAVAELEGALAHVHLLARQSAGAKEAPPGLASTRLDDTPAIISPAVIRVGYTGALSDGRPHSGGGLLTIVHRRRVLESEFAADGIRIDWKFFPSGGATNEAFARGLLDFSHEGTTGALVGRAAGLRTKLLLALNNLAATSHLAVRPASTARSLADLAGQRFATVRGTAGYLGLLLHLQEAGLKEADVIIVDLKSAAEVQTALLAGEADACILGQPFDLEAQGLVKIIQSWSPSESKLPEKGPVFWVDEVFERRYPGIVQRVVNTLVQTAAWSSDHANREAVLRLMADSNRSYEGHSASLGGVRLRERLSPILDPHSLARLQEAAADMQRFGMLDSAVDTDAWHEPKYVRHALAELGLNGFWTEHDPAGNAIGAE